METGETVNYSKSYKYNRLHLALCQIYEIPFNPRIFSNLLVRLMSKHVIGKLNMSDIEKKQLQMKYSKEDANKMMRLFKLENL